MLRSARAQIHQGVGALELVGLPRGGEAAARQRGGGAALRSPSRTSSTAPVVDDIEKASFALLDYLARMLAGKPVSPLSLFPQYRAVQEAAGAERVHPADLWNARLALARAAGRPAGDAAPGRRGRRTGCIEAQLLGLMRTTQQTRRGARA